MQQPWDWTPCTTHSSDCAHQKDSAGKSGQWQHCKYFVRLTPSDCCSHLQKIRFQNSQLLISLFLQCNTALYGQCIHLSTSVTGRQLIPVLGTSNVFLKFFSHPCSLLASPVPTHLPDLPSKFWDKDKAWYNSQHHVTSYPHFSFSLGHH